MFDIKWIRENPESFDAGLARRFVEPKADALIELDAKRRAAQTREQEIQNRRNYLSKEIAQRKARKEGTSDLLEEVSLLKDSLAKAEEEARTAQKKLHEALAELPNLLHASVPVGEDEASNIEVRRWGTPESAGNSLEHFELGERLGQMDFKTAALVSGARFVYLLGDLARLGRALTQFFLDIQTDEFGHLEVDPPVIVRAPTLFGSGHLPKFEEDLFKLTDGRYLISTSEIPLVNFVREQIIEGERLPLRYTAFSACFRSEAGSAGRDTRGMIRLHQFNKVEMVAISEPEKSMEELDRMTNCAEGLLKKLELPFRTLVLSSGDTGNAAMKTFDVEVWLPGQKRYREISSCSNTGDYQTRRMNTRFRYKGEKATRFPHALNGSGLPIGRTLVAVMENYQEEDGSIAIPQVLRPYMKGKEKITAVTR